mmetsp:Transcript_40047/g.100197  ORF Transcript_40047/g.100197 Transcript_40047/m.100197 type:complete len:201 (+) Transcript_40047:136-738(+)
MRHVVLLPVGHLRRLLLLPLPLCRWALTPERLAVEDHQNTAPLQPGTRQNDSRVGWAARHVHQTSWVLDGVDGLDKLEVPETVDKHLPLQRHHHNFIEQLDVSDGTGEGQLRNAPAQPVVPQHHLGGRPSRCRAAADEREHVAAVEHGDDGDAGGVRAESARAVVQSALVVVGREVSLEHLFERIRVEDLEARRGAAGEA